MTDGELLLQFEACTLPREEWTHRAHVKVAFLYLRDHSFEVAVGKMRAGVLAYNKSQKEPEGPNRGYNETTTVAFLHLIAATMAAYGNRFPTPDADSFCDTHPHLLNKHILRLFYSPQRRSNPEAKWHFVEPDLTDLPTVLQRDAVD